MGLYDEILKNVDGGACPRCILLPLGGGYFEGVKAVEDFSSERVVLCFPKVRVEVEGEGLVIKKYYDGDLELSGQIVAWRVDVPTASGRLGRG